MANDFFSAPNFSEFKNSGFDMSKRQEVSFSDELVFRKAKIYKVMGPNDDRLQLQILPELQDIETDEMDDLPAYPPFFKGQVLTGKDYITDGDDAEYVWVLCTPDLQVCYVLGKANVFGESNKTYEDSYRYDKISEYIDRREALPEDFDYKHINIIQWVATKDGGMVECYNYLTGDWLLLNTSGAVLTVQQQRIFMRVGTPPDAPYTTAAAHSSITMTPDALEFVAPVIHFKKYQSLHLGHHNLAVGGMLGIAPAIDNGVPVLPASNIFI